MWVIRWLFFLFVVELENRIYSVHIFMRRKKRKTRTLPGIYSKKMDPFSAIRKKEANPEKVGTCNCKRNKQTLQI